MMMKRRNSQHNHLPFCGKCCGILPPARTVRTREKRAWGKEVATF